MKSVAAPCTPRVRWMLTGVRLKADAAVMVKCPDRMQKNGEVRFLWKGKGIEVKKRI